MSISERIAELRKAAGMTQEQLGRKTGVSAQAVSKWENGGMPDVELIPLIADAFQVSIDSLFGRGYGEGEKIDIIVKDWLSSVPQEKRMRKLFDLLSAVFLQVSDMDVDDSRIAGDLAQMFPLSNDYITTKEDMRKTIWFRGGTISEEGLQLGLLTEQLPVYLLMVEPEDGFEPYLLSDEEYRELFELLSRPGALRILRRMYRSTGFMAEDLLLEEAGCSAEKGRELLQEMEKRAWIHRETVCLGDRSMEIYRAFDCGLYVPFLFSARWFMQTKEEVISFFNDSRKSPILREKEDKR